MPKGRPPERTEPPTEKVRAHATIQGLVQGVFYRVCCAERAQQLGLTGWVRNTRNGDVEAVFEGDRPAVEEILRWCRIGPPGARVTDVVVDWQPYRGEFPRFAITR